jgi:uncharacterized protein
MGKSIISKGKTVKEAIDTALFILAVDSQDVDIEIMEVESKKLLGFGTKPAVVRVSIKEAAAQPGTQYVIHKEEGSGKTSESLPDPIENSGDLTALLPNRGSTDRDGKAWVLDGHIYCKTIADKYPVITPGKGIMLFKNDVLEEQPIVITEDDLIRVELPSERKEPVWELSVSDDKLEVMLKITPGFHMFRKLRDVEPSVHIELEAEERKELYPIEISLIREKLQEMGIIFGIDYLEIARACSTSEPGIFTIARGVKPLTGKHGTFAPKKSLNPRVGLKEKEDGTVDYKELRDFPSVEHGEVIGIIEAPVAGTPGVDIYGQKLEPPEIHPVVVKAGRGVALVENGAKVVATEAGQPDIKIKKQYVLISVSPKLLHGSDVNMKSGNIRFIGDVEISGSVQDGMLVEAGGNLLVHGNVNIARITSGRSVIVLRNIISSEVIAGKNMMVVAELSRILGEIIIHLKQMMSAIQQLSTVSAFKMNSFTSTGLGSLLKILCEGKFKALVPLILDLTTRIRLAEHSLDSDWIVIGDILYKRFIFTHQSAITSLDQLTVIIHRLEEIHQVSMTPSGEECFLQFENAQNGHLFSSGDMISSGQGCYNSKLHAVGRVHIAGFFRGGELFAQKGMKIKEAGGRGEVITKLAVPQDQTIQVEHILSGTIVQIGQKQHRFHTDASHITARINTEGNLILY